MPSVSAKQKATMAAAANNPKFADKVGIKQSVARKFHFADMVRDAMRGMRKRKPGGMKK